MIIIMIMIVITIVNDNDDYDIIPVTPRRNNGKTPGGAGSGIFTVIIAILYNPFPLYN